MLLLLTLVCFDWKGVISGHTLYVLRTVGSKGMDGFTTMMCMYLARQDPFGAFDIQNLDLFEPINRCTHE